VVSWPLTVMVRLVTGVLWPRGGGDPLCSSGIAGIWAGATVGGRSRSRWQADGRLTTQWRSFGSRAILVGFPVLPGLRCFVDLHRGPFHSRQPPL